MSKIEEKLDTEEQKEPIEDLEQIIENIDTSARERKVVEVLGEHTLVFEDGKFFIEDTRNPKSKKNLTRKQAKEIFLEYKIKILRTKEEKIIE